MFFIYLFLYFLLQVSYFEIYMDKIRDLLDGVFMHWAHGIKAHIYGYSTAF